LARRVRRFFLIPRYLLASALKILRKTWAYSLRKGKGLKINVQKRGPLIFRILACFRNIFSLFWKRNLNKLLYKITEAKGGQVAVASKLAYQMSLRRLFTISFYHEKSRV
jgi:hypothetical protein